MLLRKISLGRVLFPYWAPSRFPAIHKNTPALFVSLYSFIQHLLYERSFFVLGEIHSVREILTKECSKEEVVFFTLKSFYDEISKQERQLSPAMSIVLQLLNPASIPNAVRYILDTGYPDQNLERALLTLCTWLTKWTWTDNLGPLVLAFMQGIFSLFV